MGRRATKLKDLLGMVKDKASQGKAALLHPSGPGGGSPLSFHLPLLRATTHDPLAPPKPKHLDLLLSAGHSSRATASLLVLALMDRLQSTRDASVAAKCLIAVHQIVHRGSFILQDQLSVYPATGGRNYLNLSMFRDETTPLTWELSSWVRWYARYLENLLSTSRVLGYFLCSVSSALEKERAEENVSTFPNSDLLKELDSLVGLIEETCKIPDSLCRDNELIRAVTGFVSEDYLSAMEAILIRVREFGHRLSCLSFGDSVELVCALRRLGRFEEKVSALFSHKMVAFEGFWISVAEMRARLESSRREVGPVSPASEKKRVGASESARFGGRVPMSSSHDSLKFSSGRLVGLTRYHLPFQESVELFA
ncbi:putative clathrin assembly protein At4g40080 [Syzygium oleosum]|uniref:putative clathrin assembly protein At4g40080 n=1 Tax=Syzygium oleosum TaxID=219896 RepID=UPI0024BB7165|nr:putative clathrin assembly protein At4g40080 [Syzygium oleosum]